MAAIDATVEGAATGHSGLERALIAIKELGAAPEPIGLNELARQLGMPKSSLYRIFAAGRKAGLVAQDLDGRYHLGPEFIRIAFENYEHRDDVALVVPLLRTLAERFGETAQYGVLDGEDLVYLGKIEPPDQTIRMTSSVGGRNPAYMTGLGKAQLAYLLPDEPAVERYIAEHGPLEKRTAKTIVSAEALAADLAMTRERGYAIDAEELDPGVACIAFPIYLTRPRHPSGAVSVAALAHRKSVADLEAAAEEIRGLIDESFGIEGVTRPAGA